MTLRRIAQSVVIGAAALLLVTALACSEDSPPKIAVFKSPTCGCCTKWAAHLREAGFDVTTHDVDDVQPIKRRHGIDPELSSCHTAIIDGYAIEGHVPADVILRLLKERPDVAGLTVPGMPMGSPGMEGSYEEPYEVLTFDAEGNTEVFARR